MFLLCYIVSNLSYKENESKKPIKENGSDPIFEQYSCCFIIYFEFNEHIYCWCKLVFFFEIFYVKPLIFFFFDKTINFIITLRV